MSISNTLACEKPLLPGVSNKFIFSSIFLRSFSVSLFHLFVCESPILATCLICHHQLLAKLMLCLLHDRLLE